MNRCLLGALAFVAAMIAVPRGAYLLMEALQVEPPAIKLQYAKQVERVASTIPPPPMRRGKVVLVFGDSIAVGFAPKRTIPERLQQGFDLQPDRPMHVFSAANPGTAAFDYYFVADLLLPKKPDAVVIFFNLASLSEGWRRGLSRSELVGWIAPGRWLEAAAQPLSWVGLTWDRILLYQAIVHGGFEDLWYRATLQQSRVGATRRYLQELLLDTGFREAERRARNGRAIAILRKSMVPGAKRFTKRRTFEHLGPIVAGLRPDQPMLRVLGETVRIFHEQGSAVLVCVMPINLEHVLAVGASDEATIRGSIDVIRDVVTRAGGELVDLHANFPDSAFRDAAGHLRDGGAVDAARRVAEVVDVMLRAQMAAQGNP